jgi:exodeoxyribonuclease VII small subunit
MNEAETSFESAVARLEEIVAALEMGNLPLDECLRQFEHAVALSRLCNARLEAAEKQIRVLSESGALSAAADLSWASEVEQPPADAPRHDSLFESQGDWDS